MYSGMNEIGTGIFEAVDGIWAATFEHADLVLCPNATRAVIDAASGITLFLQTARQFRYDGSV